MGGSPRSLLLPQGQNIVRHSKLGLYWLQVIGQIKTQRELLKVFEETFRVIIYSTIKNFNTDSFRGMIFTFI